MNNSTILTTIRYASEHLTLHFRIFFGINCSLREKKLEQDLGLYLHKQRDLVDLFVARLILQIESFVDTAKNQPFGSTRWYTQEPTLRMWLRAQACGIEQRSSRRWSLARSSVAKMLISSHNLVDSLCYIMTLFSTQSQNASAKTVFWTEHIFSAGTARVLSCDMSRF